MPVKRTVKRSVEEKFHIIQANDKIKHENGAEAKIARQHNLLSLSTISQKEDILHNYETNLSLDRKRLKKNSFPELDSQLYSWFEGTRSNGVELSGDLILQKVKTIALTLNSTNFEANVGCFDPQHILSEFDNIEINFSHRIQPQNVNRCIRKLFIHSRASTRTVSVSESR